MLILLGGIGLTLVYIYLLYVMLYQKKTKTCDTQKCNTFMYNKIINNKQFTTDDMSPCRYCYPHVKYAWLPEYNLAIDSGKGWTSCGTKEQCYDILKWGPKEIRE